MYSDVLCGLRPRLLACCGSILHFEKLVSATSPQCSLRHSVVIRLVSGRALQSLQEKQQLDYRNKYFVDREKGVRKEKQGKDIKESRR